jgi:hypothetical protein
VARYPRGQRPAGIMGTQRQRGLVTRRPASPAMSAYRTPLTGVPLQPGQAQTTISGAGKATVSIGPAGSGTVWQPAQVTVSTTTGLSTGLDTALCAVYIGPAGVPVWLMGNIITGNGVLAVALPSLSPGQYIIAVWTGGHSGDVAAVNVTGTMSALGSR